MPDFSDETHLRETTVDTNVMTQKKAAKCPLQWGHLHALVAWHLSDLPSKTLTVSSPVYSVAAVA